MFIFLSSIHYFHFFFAFTKYLNMSYKFESEVTDALGELLKTEANYDVIIYIGKKPDFQEFHAHFVLLCCRSLHFSETLSAKDIEKKDGKCIIKKPDITPQAFDVIIK